MKIASGASGGARGLPGRLGVPAGLKKEKTPRCRRACRKTHRGSGALRHAIRQRKRPSRQRCTFRTNTCMAKISEPLHGSPRSPNLPSAAVERSSLDIQTSPKFMILHLMETALQDLPTCFTFHGDGGESFNCLHRTFPNVAPRARQGSGSDSRTLADLLPCAALRVTGNACACGAMRASTQSLLHMAECV